MNAVSRGAVDRPPLVLLAGQANDRHWWVRARPDFVEAGRRTIVLDWRGAGQSSLGHVPITTADLADDVGVGSAHVYGTSVGGRVAQWVAINHPQRVVVLVLGCTAPGGPPSFERSQQLRRRLAAANPASSRRLLADLMYTPAWQQNHPGPYTVLGDPALTPAAVVQHLRVSNGHHAHARLGEIESPTLVLHGTDDELSPVGNPAVLGNLIPGATVELSPGARHAYFDEARPSASDTALRFLDRVD